MMRGHPGAMCTPFGVLVGDGSAPGAGRCCWRREGTAKPVGKLLPDHAELRGFWTLSEKEKVLE